MYKKKMKLLFYLLLFSQVVIGQNKIIFSRSAGFLNTGGTSDLMMYDIQSKTASMILKGTIKGRGEYSPTVSPDQKKIIVNTYQFGGWKLGIAHYNNEKIIDFKKFTNRNNYEYDAMWSNNGKMVAFQEYNWSTNNTDIFISNLEGKVLKRITYAEGGDRNPCWTNDDKTIVFTSGRTDYYSIYTKSLENEKVTRLTREGVNDFAPSIRQQDNYIAFLSDRHGKIDLYKMTLNGKNLVNLTEDVDSDPIAFNGFENTGYWAYKTSWSKDGKFIVFNLLVKGNLEIFIIKSDGTGLQQITQNDDSDINPYWVK